MSIPKSNWVGQTIAGRYQIESVLGRGGMSTVYKATDPNLKRTVAIKLIHPHLSSDPEFVRRFEQEAAAVAQLRHPHIIQVYDFAHDDDVYYMVLEYVAGQTLQAQLKQLNASQKQFALSEIVRIIATVSDAVAYAHERNMIHRDLKPANVMLNTKGHPILMDFGVAKMLDAVEHTATGTVVGTAKYMSPEQARGIRPDERSDIYSLGVMLYEMTAGQPPFGGDSSSASSAVSIMMKHVNEPVPDVRQIRRNVPEGLIQIIEKALAKTPDERYQRASHLSAALRALDFGGQLREESDTFAATTLRQENNLAEVLTSITPPPTFSEQKSGRSKWILGAVAAVLLLGLLAAAVFFFSRGTSTSTLEEPGQLLASNEDELPSSRRMVRIPAGTYTVGLEAADSEHAARQEVELSEVWLDQYEATNAEYAQFLAATDNQPAPHSWSDGVLPAGQEDHPVRGITWEMAAAYCQWAQKRLPTEAEWEVAARGTTGSLYPWGDDDRAVELPRAETYVGGSVAENRSPFGAFDMAGNVWEWVDEPYAPIDEGNRLLRGGAYGFVQDMAYRLQGDPSVPTMSATSGVRCAADQVKDDGGPGLAGNVLYSDDFTDPESGWPVLAEDVGLFGYHPPDFYHVEVSIPEAHQAVTRGPNFDNVTVESDIFVEKFDTDSGDFRYGLVLHRSGNDYYAFTVSNRSQTWSVLKSSTAGIEEIAQGSSDLIRGQGREKADRFRVDANAGQFTFWLNEQPLAQFRDTSYATGEVGFFLENFDQTMAHIHYDTLNIRQVEPGDVTVTLPGVLYSDDFTDPESGWPVLAEDVGLFGYHPPAFYHVEVSVPEVHQAVTRGPDFDNVTVESDLFVEKTDTETGDFRYGLVLRRSGDDYYVFTISNRSQIWSVLKSSAAGFELLAEGSSDTIQGDNRASADNLRVDANGSDFIFHLNGQPVTLVTDADYASGEVGFFVENFDETLSHIHYDTLTIREVEFEAETVPPTATPLPPSPTPTVAPASDSDVIAIPEETAPTEEPGEGNGSSLSEVNPAAVAEVESPEGMVLVPAGYFQMGSATGSRDETPAHPVLLDAFFLDQYEVTEADYQRCVVDGSCGPVEGLGLGDNYPVVNVSWDDAELYCWWAGKRLPTEAEWEYAAGGAQNFTWPWGDEFDPDLLAADGAAQPVDRFPAGASPFGIEQMSGNVAEWVADVFDPDFYANSPAANPLGKGPQSDRIYRGGSYRDRDEASFTTSRRATRSKTFRDIDIGLRCAKDAPDATPTEQQTALEAEFCEVYGAYKPDATCP